MSTNEDEEKPYIYPYSHVPRVPKAPPPPPKPPRKKPGPKPKVTPVRRDPRNPTRENLDPPSLNRSSEDRQEFKPVIEHLIIQNLTDTEIAKIAGIDRKAVANIRKTSARKADLSTNPARPGTVQHGQESLRVTAECLRLRAEGLTYVEIAEQVGIGWNSVRSRLRNAYKDYMLEMRDAVAGRQVADIEVVRNELLEVIIRDHRSDLEEVMSEGDSLDDASYADVKVLINKAFEKGRKNQDTKFRAMEVLIKLMDREAKLYGLDADSNVNVNHSIKIEPQAIELLQRLEGRKPDSIIDAEIVEETLGSDS